MSSITKSNHFQLRHYQNRGLDFILNFLGRGVALFIPPGLGKTAILLHVIKRKNVRALYVAPKRVAASVPTNEVPKWAELTDLPVHIVEGNEEERIAILQRKEVGAAVWTIGYHQLHWLVTRLNDGSLKIPRFKILILDESTKIKNPKTQTFKACYGLCKAADLVLVATGTPSVQGLQGLWAQCAVLDHGEALGKSYSAFLHKYFAKQGFSYYSHSQTEKQIQQAIKPMTFALQAQDWIELPQIIRKDIVVELSADISELIATISTGDSFTVRAPDGNDYWFPNAENPATTAMRIWQLTQGFLKVDETTTLPMHDAKLDALLDMVEELNGEPVLVAHHFQHDRARILVALEAAGITGVEVFDAKTAVELQAQLTRWREKKISVLLINAASGGIGVDGLQAHNNLIIYGQQWSVELALQLEARLARSGGKESVIIQTIVAKDSLDEAIRYAIERGAKGNEALIEALAYRDAKAKVKADQSQDFEKTYQEKLAELRKQMQQTHPDRGGQAEDFIKARSQYERFKKDNHAN